MAAGGWRRADEVCACGDDGLASQWLRNSYAVELDPEEVAATVRLLWFQVVESMERGEFDPDLLADAFGVAAWSIGVEVGREPDKATRPARRQAPAGRHRPSTADVRVKLTLHKKGTAAEDILFPEPTPVPLRTKDSVPNDTALFPMHVYTGRLPNLVSMRVDASGKPVVLATAGGVSRGPTRKRLRCESTPIRSGGSRRRRKVTSQPQPKKRVPGRFCAADAALSSTWRRVLIATATAVALAVIGVVLDEQPFLWVAVVGLLASVGECARAATDIRGAFGAEGD